MAAAAAAAAETGSALKGEAVYRLQSPHAEPVRPSWKNMPWCEGSFQLSVRISHVTASLMIFRQAADDGHHRQTSVRKLGSELFFALLWVLRSSAAEHPRITEASVFVRVT